MRLHVHIQTLAERYNIYTSHIYICIQNSYRVIVVKQYMYIYIYIYIYHVPYHCVEYVRGVFGLLVALSKNFIYKIILFVQDNYCE